MSRRNELLVAAAETLDELSDPFNTSWLSEHHVTLDECGDLSEDLANAAKIYASMKPEERVVALMRVDLGDEVADAMARSMGLSNITKALRDF